MNYTEEAEDFHKQVNMRLSMTDEQWLRQHDARLIRELAAMPKYQWDSYEEGRIDAWLELRADEIESEIGEKP